MAVSYTVTLDNTTAASQPEGTGGSPATFTFDIASNSLTDQNITYELWNVTAGEPGSGGVPASGVNDFGAAYTGTGVAPHGGTLQITLQAAADNVVEGNQTYELWVWTSSTGSATHSTATTNITVVDDDGLGITTPNSVNVAENQTAVETVASAGGTGTYAYALTSPGAGGGADDALFHIDASTGALTFVSAPDYEAGAGHGSTANDYLVEVTVTSGGSSKVQDLTVHVTNVDDVAPTITGGAAATASVAENTTAAFHTETIATVDAASTSNTWSISGGADGASFKIDPTTGALAFVSAPDFEHGTGHGADNDHYLVQVKLTDSAGLSATQDVTVAVTDVVEPTVFTSYNGNPNVFVHEHDGAAAGTGTVIGTVTATNDDHGNTPTLTLTGADAGWFNIGAGGVITFAPGFSPDFSLPSDSNADNTYQFTVDAHTAEGDAFQSFAVIIDDPNAPAGGSGGYTPPPTTTPYTPTVIYGQDGGQYIQAGAQDTVVGGGGNDSIDGGSGDNVISGGAGNDFIRGFDGNDNIDGGPGNDDVNGNMGNDTVTGGDGADSVRGGQGNDFVYGGAGDDPHVNGNLGDDVVHGEDGNDTVYGGQGNDTVFGDAGNDQVSGDLGNDILYGGPGADRFMFAPGGGTDWVGDFNAAEGDHVVLPTGTAYTVTNYLGQVLITLSTGDAIGLANVPYSSFSTDWIQFS